MCRVAILSFNDLLNQLADFLLPDTKDLDSPEAFRNPTDLCVAQGALDTFAELSSVMWTTAIAFTLYMSVFKRMTADELKSKMVFFYAACYGLPIIAMVLPLALGAYGPAGAWCWIKDDFQWLRFVVFYIPLWIAIIFNAVVYTWVIRLIASTYAEGTDDASAKQLDTITRKLRLYPIILVFVWLPATVNRIVEWSIDDQVFALFVIQKVCSSSQGFCNAFAYGFSQGVREALQDTLQRHFPTLCPDPHRRKMLRGVGTEDDSFKHKHDSLVDVRRMDSAAQPTRNTFVPDDVLGDGLQGEGEALPQHDSLASGIADGSDIEVGMPPPAGAVASSRADRVASLQASRAHDDL